MNKKLEFKNYYFSFSHSRFKGEVVVVVTVTRVVKAKEWWWCGGGRWGGGLVMVEGVVW